MNFDHLNMRQQVLAAGLLRRAGLEHRAFSTQHNESLQSLIFERAGAYERHSLADICAEILRIEGLPQECNARETTRTALSTASAGSVFTAVANASLVEGFLAAPDSTAGWTVSAEAESFKPFERHVVNIGGLKKHARGATAQLMDFEAGLRETYRIARYTGQAGIDEQDIEDDRLQALTELPREMGAAARELRVDLVCSILLANKPLDADSVALFDSATHANADSGGGSALSESALGTGVQRVAAQRVLGRALNLQAKYLIVPSNLHVAARALLRTLDRDDRENIILRSDDRLGVAGVIDPVDGTQYAGTTTNWWLSTSAQRTIEVSTLRNSGPLPVIREWLLTQGQYGIGWDVKYDIAAKSIDFRGLYHSAGV